MVVPLNFKGQLVIIIQEHEEQSGPGKVEILKKSKLISQIWDKTLWCKPRHIKHKQVNNFSVPFYLNHS